MPPDYPLLVMSPDQQGRQSQKARGAGGKSVDSAHTFALANTKTADATAEATADASCFLLNVFMLVSSFQIKYPS
ncbi:MAG: hypothetical protein HZT40_17135 [Candidatus Thiothrix singaporensis]|uniref:Uncharacterized protein n=1 Tax=Candidatus Thiothrix singaporensis TaxID=2799669 RepID=A0A7L6AV45_9GAMM|nr:MAG: hypothetical protein HZT40_17135 [Candidatus Thiothrix singaporensis]